MNSAADLNARIIEDVLKQTEGLPPEKIAGLVAGLVYALAKRSTQANKAKSPDNDGNRPQHDRLLKVDEAAQRLGCSKDRLYRHPKEFRGFEVPPEDGRAAWHWSERGIDEYIARRRGANND